MTYVWLLCSRFEKNHMARDIMLLMGENPLRGLLESEGEGLPLPLSPPLPHRDKVNSLCPASHPLLPHHPSLALCTEQF
jgi:hypothetical protein